jgi:hypothetical protein
VLNISKLWGPGRPLKLESSTSALSRVSPQQATLSLQLHALGLLTRFYPKIRKRLLRTHVRAVYMHFPDMCGVSLPDAV